MDNLIDKACQTAIMESELSSGFHALRLGKNFGEGINPKTLVNPFSNKYIVNIYDKPVSFKDFVSHDPDVRATSGFFTIRYVPKNHRDRVKDKPYIIGQDLVRLRVTVSGPKHWGALCNRIPELAWIRRNTTFKENMFPIAKMHPGLVLRFTLDVPKYCEKITNRANELGIDIDHKPLVAFGCSGEDYTDIYSKKELCEIRTKADYLKELAEAESAVQLEKED